MGDVATNDPFDLNCEYPKGETLRMNEIGVVSGRVPAVKIVSGGQTGVDQGGLEAAVALGLDYGGWAPHRWLAEKPFGEIPVRYRTKMREYADCRSNAANYRERTKANVRDSQATLILVERLPLEGGTKLTRDFAASIGRSHHVADMSAENALAEAAAWLRQFLRQPTSLVLNVAGPRESKSPGIQGKAKAFLCGLLQTVCGE